MKNLSIALLAMLALSACSAPVTLQEKLTAKSKIERAQVLKSECLSEAAWRKSGSQYQQSALHVRKLKEICETMGNELGLKTAEQPSNTASAIEP